MEENPWANGSLDMQMNDEVNECLCYINNFDEEFLRDILQQPQEAIVAVPDHNDTCSSLLGGNLMIKKNNSSSIMSQHSEGKSTSSSPTTYVLSFEKSAAMLPTDHDTLPLPTSRASHGNKKTRRGSESLDHIMLERNRRQELRKKFIALASTIPGLKKMDKAHVLREAINYVKQLQGRVEELEEDIQKNGVESVITITRSHLSVDDDSNTGEFYGPNEILPKVEARTLGNEVLIKIHCAKQKGILLKIMSQLERRHFYISTSNVLPFGNTLDITIIAQMGNKYNLVMKDLVKELRQVAMM